MKGYRVDRDTGLLLLSALLLLASLALLTVSMVRPSLGRRPFPASGDTGYSSGRKNSSESGAGYAILIETQQKKLYLLRDGKPVKAYACAVGKLETPSPLGSFRIVEKSHWGEGFGGYWLGLDCPWGQYGIHGTLSPASIGSSASHGCFRMFNSDVQELYGFVAVGTPVLVTGGIYGAFGSGFRPLSPGMYGQDVLAVQKRLRALGYYAADCNGRYGSALKSAVHSFQKGNGLPVSDTIDERMFTALGFVLME